MQQGIRFSLAQKRQDYRIMIRRQDKQKQQKLRRQSLLTSQSQLRQGHQEYLNQILQQFGIPFTDFRSAIVLFPHLQHLISSPSSHPSKILYLSLLSDQIYFKPSACTVQIIEYVSTFIRNTKYRELAGERQFEKEFINLLEAITSQVELSVVSDLKRSLLAWCMGTRSIRVINYSITDFPSMAKYPELYQVIKMGIMSQNNDISEASAHTIVTLGRYSDYDDIESIYSMMPEIFTNLLQRLMDCPHTQRRQAYCQALICLCNTYDSVVRDYALLGLGQMASDLITKGIEGEITMGLRMFRDFSYSKAEGMKEFLLRDSYILASEVWAQIATLHKSLNTEHRKNMYVIFSQMLVNMSYDELNQFRTLIKIPLLDILQHGLTNQENPFIVLNLVIMLEVLLFYSQSMKQVNMVNYVAIQVEKLGLFARLEQIAVGTQCTRTQEICERVLQRYYRMQ